jgi:hypothetical protein
MDRVSYSEWAILRCSPEPKFGTISILRKQLSQAASPGRTLINRRRCPYFFPIAAAALAFVSMAPSARAQRGDTGDWIDTWTASPQPIWDAEFFAPINVPRALRDETVRQIAAISIGGNRVRVVLSNEYGSKPLVIGAAHVAVAGFRYPVHRKDNATLSGLNHVGPRKLRDVMRRAASLLEASSSAISMYLDEMRGGDPH